VSAAPPRCALVTGASRGLGLALVRALLARGDPARVFAAARAPERSDGLRALAAAHGDALRTVGLDVRDERSISAAAEVVRAATSRLHLVIQCAGVLHDGDALRPEKKLADVDPAMLRTAFEVNAIGPLLVAKHLVPLLRHGERAVLAHLSARVGSIGDNRLGGWYAYRASKAAQNMLTRTLAIELARSARHVVCVALHPGTVDTDLSRPFQRGVPAERLQSADEAAVRLLAVLDSLGPDDHGSFLDPWRRPIPW
jgi:NAD(P)-dependent dehydrogenase (short-subunit alcohol dehydrogenase family)